MRVLKLCAVLRSAGGGSGVHSWVWVLVGLGAAALVSLVGATWFVVHRTRKRARQTEEDMKLEVRCTS